MQMAKCLESLHLLENTFLPKLFFPEGMGCVQNSSGNSKGVGVILVVKKWKLWGGRGAYVKFPPWWGYGYFLELHIVNWPP